jgi:hypothetical protein
MTKPTIALCAAGLEARLAGNVERLKIHTEWYMMLTCAINAMISGRKRAYSLVVIVVYILVKAV